ncbi:MAG: antibiotic biosynthesis monooxygenase [Ignavibacteriae bacterium]|nr:antibiotic biosynthesis monooxygenase [Ignavibacteriota bacterium]MCB9206184.1 antibiotic biosynthesis monooxygenase [Ignavibacteriales bacterium]MCB9210828.1 antibiotic biosynthesis monooxygenase [Ignavibacteriales bacterium]MCB9217876.1 antibiotic biosynthesis monooxygenase [Ignavibacteriales bacterium]
MSRVIFSISYDIIPDKRAEYLDVVRELKSIIKSDGLLSYSVFEQKSKENSFQEIYIYESEEAWENADESENERVDILMTKLSDLIKEKSTHYSTLFEV